MNCKPGDLAYLLASFRDENVGRVVQVVRRAGDHWLMGPMWVARACGPLPTVDYGGRPSGDHATAECPDAWLRPISGVPVHDEQRDEVPA